MGYLLPDISIGSFDYEYQRRLAKMPTIPYKYFL